MNQLLEAIPLTVFLLYIRNINTEIAQNWKAPFVVSGLLALAIIVLFLYRKIPLNRIFLGINLYLFSGGIAFITHQWWLNRLYNDLQASGMLLWIIMTGGVSLLLSPKGFIGVDSPDKEAVNKFSVYLLIIAVCAFALSYYYRGSSILSEAVPFAGLFILQNSFKARLAGKNQESAT